MANYKSVLLESIITRKHLGIPTMPTASTTSLKLDLKIKRRLQRLASARRRSPHWIMREAIEQYVEREEKRELQHHRQAAAYRVHAVLLVKVHHFLVLLGLARVPQ